MPPLETRTNSPGETPEVPKIHVSTGEESSGSGTDSTQGLMPWHGRVRNPAGDKVMRKEADIRKACSDFRDPSGNS